LQIVSRYALSVLLGTSKDVRKIKTIRSRLLIGFVLMALLPAIAISAGSIVVGYRTGRQQALARLESAAALKETRLAEWSRSLHDSLLVALNEEYAPERASIVLTLAREDKYLALYTGALRNRFRRFIEQTQQLDEIFLLALDGRVVLSTDESRESRSYHDQPFFQRGLAGPYTQLPFGSSIAESPAVIAAVPVSGADGQILGVMAGRADLQGLTDILDEPTGLGRTGKSYLSDADYRLLLGTEATGAQPTQPVHTLGIDAAITTRHNGTGAYRDYRGVRVLAVYRWLPELQVALLAEQDQSEAFRAILTTLSVNVLIALLAALLAVGAALLITRSISAPLGRLVETATHIAGGDLERVAEFERQDEIGALARAFNSMTAQLRDLIGGLEQRVRERTQALRRQALQLQTSAQVSREITSILDIDDLLGRVTELIRAAFGYYHVHVYLVDKEAGRLVLRASSAAVGTQPRHLPIGGNSLNGQAAQANQSLLVNNVSQDPRYLADPLLPDTCAELVVPLRVGDQVIGTLDVHSAQVNAFSPEDVLVVQSLGDQIAIAIENARHYEQALQVAVVEERQRLAQELHDSVTQSLYSLTLFAEAGRELAEAGKLELLKQYQIRMGETAHQALKEMRLLLYELRPLALEQGGLLRALHHRLDAVERRTGVQARLVADESFKAPAHVEEDLYRIAQEALNNALKHSAASSVTVTLCAEKEGVGLEVLDDGQGFDPVAVSDGGGMGLLNMRQRVARLGGQLQIASAPGQGTQVKVRVRCAND
jgi:nitrate/nitrite-specific signal transduction histidine kinase